MTSIIEGISITGVHVYDKRPSPDGKLGGCPYIHAVAHEVYIVHSGHGSVEFHEPDQGMWIEDLHPGKII
ncbi:MAG: hypothetical protein AAF558_06990 [Verrucomicrobiota bacterium]